MPATSRASTVDPVRGYVLCGGASRRMGTRKAALVVDGRSLVETAVAALRAGGASAATVGGPASPGIAHVADIWPGEGPLGGILTAVADAPAGTEAVVILSCDMPAIDGSAVASLVGALRGAPSAEIAVATARGRLQPVCLAARPSAAAVMQAAFSGGERSVSAAIRRLPLVEVPVAPARVAGVNTPAELEQARRRADR